MSALSTAAEPGGLTFDWSDGAPHQGPCPNCGAAGPSPLLVLVRWTGTKKMAPMRRAIYACPNCDARFYETMRLPDYHHEETRVIGWPQFYIQQNAGLWPVTAPIARIAKPRGARFLEIGGGYGFGLDFAIHALGWTGMGIDPSPLAERGRAELGLPVRVGYFPEADDSGGLPWDAIVATEVIEHMDHPGVLLRDIAARIAPDGVVLLTTPDGGAIAPGTPYEALEQILVPEIHMVFQTVRSLEHALRTAGFAHVAVTRDAHSVVAFASMAPLALDDDPALLRRRFRAYLDGRAANLDPVSDAGIGLLGRALFEAANDGDFAAAAAARDLLFPAIRRRFGLDLATIETLPEPCLEPRLAALKDRIPFNLGPVMYAEAMRRIGLGATRAEVVRELGLAGQTAGVLVEALRALWLTDAMSEDIAFRARAEQAIGRAEAGDDEAVALLAGLKPRGETDATRRIYLWRGVIELTNADATGAARALRAAEGLGLPDADLPADLRRDIHIVLGQLALAEGGDPAQAIAMANALGASDPVVPDLLLGGFIRLVNAARYDEAIAVAERVIPLACSRTDAAGTDARAALAIAYEKTADPAAIPALIRPLALPPARRDAILLDAFSRLVGTARYDEAVAMADAENIVSRAVARDDDAGRDARLALALLDLATGDPMDVPARLSGLTMDAGQRRAFLIGAFSRLINAARYAEAARFAGEQAIEILIGDGGDEPARDATIGIAILDLVVGDPAMAPARIADIAIDAERRRQIMLGAFVTLVNRSRYDEALALRDAAPIEAWAAAPEDADGADASIALIALGLATGDPAEVPALLDRLPHLASEVGNDARAQATLRLIHLGRLGEARPLIATIDLSLLDPASRSDLVATEAHFAIEAADTDRLAALLDTLESDAAEPARIKALAVSGFVTAVNRGDFAAASLLRGRIEPDFANYAKAATEGMRSAGFALGVLDLQEPAQPHRAEAAFAAVRRGFAAELAESETAPALFWESLRGEIIALHQTSRAAEATALGRAMLARYRGAPEDLAQELMTDHR
ncbi:class I SAM-dependent methyltransferase [Acidiphilium iwatense]|uniref:Class I SAM-dependent methyltransferase n=1 Tax=Acidiphilium iwatense TaxID=768198 RepID=A0ABS9DWM1_9PROT|nr:class I SAM-dependent methyltransferase [Acidiphilium iwatense]MCF3945837.1 class I SAM-dependent methyltransferase [Acidiphilium iwatense]